MTQTQAHTPGPSWRAAAIIARDIIGDETYIDEIAQIIAEETAVPDLLEALTRLDDHVTELIDLYGDKAPITAGIIDITTSARAALAKAKDGE